MNQRSTTAAHEPTVPVSLSPPPSRRWGIRRRLLVAALVVAALLATVAGVYAWQLLGALDQAEESSYVPLPTSTGKLAVFPPTRTPTPDDIPTSTPATTRSVVSVGPATPGRTPGAVPEATPAGTPIASPVSPGAATPALAGTTGTEQTPLVTPEELSQLEVLRLIIGASMEGGDPGLSSIWGGKPYINVLVLGVDRRPDGGDQNSDVIIIARVDLLTKKVTAVSLPRDLRVEIPGIGPGKINGAYNAGVLASPGDEAAGVAMVRDTIESVYGIFVDGYVMIDFDGFEDVVDAVGGVDIVVPEAIVDDAYPTIDYGTERVEFGRGLQHMDGDRALKYVRTRNTDDDDARRERQLQVLLALFDQASSLGSIQKADEIIVALGDNVQTGFRLQQKLTLARVGWEMDRADITLTTLEAPLITGGYDESGAWVYFSDPATVAAFINQTLEAGSTAGS